MLAGLALSESQLERPANAGSVAAVPTSDAVEAESRFLMSVLSDSHAYNAGSWWRQTIGTGTFPDAYLGEFESLPGAVTSSLTPMLDAVTAQGGAVVVQAGTNDLLSQRTPEQAVEGLSGLWQGIRDRGAVPVAALVPPSDEVPQLVVELNRLIRTAAAEQGLELIDVYTSVAQSDGTWADGNSDDARHANGVGSALMADAAREQLPRIIDALD
ncbi:esterase [Clavibacter nebraskensis]|uniref:Hydrolase n=1 Tax=Clavibacter nebraskensis NCPPB 2581 TaxID=1097677 RepID=A0AAI8ZJV1_9MICO|nr:esterase [Clavibacter nebraskensis]OAH18517.1 esterase [Clavibacter nebraskensis]CCE76401.1 putative hydrolase [Clavibacter nebraskensis NCPPB 2581]